nr:neuron navigator 2-like [Meriones unguiculatus]
MERNEGQIYTDWANHYLAKSGHKRLIKDLQQDVTDGVLLAQIIQVVANDKIEDINGCPKNRSQMIENIDACLNFLAAKGINTQGLSAEEIRNGNLKAILGLFFSLSRYKQQQQQQQQPPKQHLSSSPLPPAGPQVAGTPSHCQAGIPQQQGLATPQAPCQPLQPASHQQAKTQAEMQSSASSKDSSQSKIICFTLGQKKISRLAVLCVLQSMVYTQPTLPVASWLAEFPFDSPPCSMAPVTQTQICFG